MKIKLRDINSVEGVEIFDIQNPSEIPILTKLLVKHGIFEPVGGNSGTYSCAQFVKSGNEVFFEIITEDIEV